MLYCTEVHKVLDLLESALIRNGAFVTKEINKRPFLTEKELDAFCETPEEEEPLSQQLGVPQAVFPAIECLESDEAEALLEKMLDVLESRRYIVEIPDEVCSRVAYTVLVSHWDDPVPIEVCRYGFIGLLFSELYDDILDSND